MKQYINLYKKVEHNVDDAVTAVFITEVLSVIMLILLVISSSFIYQKYNSSKELEKLIESNTVTQNELTRIKEKIQKAAIKSKSRTEYERYKKKYEEAQGYLSVMEEFESNRDISINKILNGFAYSHVYGMWINSIKMTNYGREYQVKGFSQTRLLVDTFVNNLRNESVFDRDYINSLIVSTSNNEDLNGLEFIFIAKTGGSNEKVNP